MTDRTSASTFVNDTEIRVIGLSRSGSHAVIQWLLAQLPGRWCFLNAANPGANPFTTCRPMDDGIAARANFSEFDLARESAGEFTRKDFLVYSHEDVWLGACGRGEFARERDTWVGGSARRIDLLVLRDPFNLFASRLQLAKRWPFVRPTVRMAQMWRQHARAFLGERRYLRCDVLPVSFNRWVVDREHRRAIAERIGFRFTDAGRDRIANAGGGSSFDGRNYDGCAGRMQLLERWRSFAGAHSFDGLFDAQTLNLTRRIFGGSVVAQVYPQADPLSAKSSSLASVSRGKAALSARGCRGPAAPRERNRVRTD